MTDCISRKETIEWLKRVTVTDGITFETGFKQILTDIDEMPSVQPMRAEWVVERHGKWLYMKCSNCESLHDVSSKYCPDCGCLMRREDDEE